MKKDIRVIKRIISFILVLILVCTSSINSHAIVKGEDSLDIDTNAETIMEMDDTRIDYYETSEGDRVFKANDSKYDCNDTFYEGYLPSDWKTSALAIEFHNELFTYSVFTVEGWS